LSRPGRLLLVVHLPFLGDQKQLKKLLEMGGEMGFHYKVVSISDAKFSLDSPLNVLTEK